MNCPALKRKAHQLLWNLVLTGCSVLLTCSRTQCATATDSPPVQFQDGDSVCFIGDSITHAGAYHAYIMLFYATRFPDRRIETHNCGLSGDTAGGALSRFASDIEPCKPSVASLMFGMNDVNRDLYGQEVADKEIGAQRKAAIDAYADNMAKLSQELAKSGCKLIFITPSIYDQTGNQATPNHLGVNDALAACGREAGLLAARFNGGLVDFHGPMGRINADWQKKDPSFTIVGSDRVHPGEPGHLVMAYAFLTAQGVPAVVSGFSLDATAGTVSTQDNCTVSRVGVTKNGITFDCLEKALPFPVPDGASSALELVPFTDKLNREILTVSGLEPGTYDILIDGEIIDSQSADALKIGINLANNHKTPQWKQAARVRDINDKRHNLVAEKLRSIATIRHYIISCANPKPADDEAVKKIVEARLEQNRRDNFTYGVLQIESYLKYQPEEKAIEKEVADTWLSMYIENQPKSHHYEIREKNDGD